MYRWAFVGSQHDTCGGHITNGHSTSDDILSPSSSCFVPHVRRIARLMDLRFTNHSPVIENENTELNNEDKNEEDELFTIEFDELQKPRFTKGKYLSLTCQSIINLQDLYGFFATLGTIWPLHDYDSVEKNVSECLAEIETVLSADFLEKMPSTPSR